MQLSSLLPADRWVLLGMHLALGVVFVVAFAANLRTKGAATPVVLRGPQSMGIFTATFATTLGLYYAALDLAAALIGHKSIMVVVDFIVISYLFLVNNWFRNHVLAAAAELAKE